MDPEHPEPANLRELRILVLHNRDFDESVDHKHASNLLEASRADVANAAQSIARALVSRGHFVEVQGIDVDDLGDLLAQLRQDPPDLVFNLVESLASSDRHCVLVPALLDLLAIPYTGPGLLCSAVVTYKQHAKSILRAAGIPTPLGTLLPELPQPPSEDLAAVQSIGYPLFLKMAEYSGSIGISDSSIVRNDEGLIRQLDFLRSRYRGPIIAEHFVDGREIYVGMLGNSPRRILPIQEIDFSRAPHLPPIVSEVVKWSNLPEYDVLDSSAAAPMPDAVRARIEEVARHAFDVLEFRDCGRVDIRLSSNGTPYVIDFNPNCDLSDGAGYSRAGILAGLSYDQLILEIALSALTRSAYATVQRQGRDHGHGHHSPGSPKRSGATP